MSSYRETVSTLHVALENGSDLHVNERQKIWHYRARSTEEEEEGGGGGGGGGGRGGGGGGEEEEQEQEERQTAIFYFARRASKLRYYGDVIY